MNTTYGWAAQDVYGIGDTLQLGDGPTVPLTKPMSRDDLVLSGFVPSRWQDKVQIRMTCTDNTEVYIRLTQVEFLGEVQDNTPGWADMPGSTVHSASLAPTA